MTIQSTQGRNLGIQGGTLLTNVTFSLANLLSVVWMITVTVLLNSMVTISPAYADGLSDLFGNNSADSAQGDFLQVDKAFTVIPIQQGDKLTLSLEITPDYYLYKDKFSLALPDGVTAKPFTFSKSAHSIDDPNFGRVAIFDQPQVTATTTLTNTNTAPINQNITLTWQGCAKAGLCYPPQKQLVPVSLKATESANLAETSTSSDNKSTAQPTKSTTASNNASNAKFTKSDDKQSQSATQSSKPSITAKDTDTTNKKDSNKTPVKTVEKDSSQQSKSTVATIADGSNLAIGDLNDGVDVKAENTQSNDPNNIDETDATNGIGIDAANSATDEPVSPNGSNLSSNNLSTASTANVSLDTDTAINQDPFGLAKHPWLALILLFLAGLGLAFTPCVLPMLPIVSNIIARQHNPTAKGGLLLSGSYGIGVAVAYGILGAVIAVFGQSLGIIGWLQNPIILLTFAAIFILLALYMLDAFVFPVPKPIKHKLQHFSQAGDHRLGSSLGSFIAGFLSALVVSPCVSAPLFGALLAVATIGNPILGFAALFMLGLGLSAPLMLLGVSQGNFMPKAGEWMNWVKQGFALLLFGVALLLISRVLISPIMLVLWAFWLMMLAVWAWLWQGRGKLFSKSMAIILALWSTACVIGAAAGSEDLLQPLAVFQQRSLQSLNLAVGTQNSKNVYGSYAINSSSSDIRISSLEELLPIVETTDKVLVDVTAEWCVECRIMDKTLFTNRPAMLQDWQVVKLDITESNAASKRVLTELKLFGPPALLYFVEGELKRQQVGTIERSEFEKTLSNL